MIHLNYSLLLKSFLMVSYMSIFKYFIYFKNGLYCFSNPIEVGFPCPEKT